MTQSVTVTNAAELRDALSSAEGGETILLEDGDYGSLSISNMNFDSWVSLVSMTSKGAQFDKIEIDDSSFISIDGVHVDNGSNGSAASSLVQISSSDDIQVKNSEINGLVDDIYDGHFGITTGNSSNVLVENNFIHDVKRAGVFHSTEGLQVVGNTADYLGDDNYKFIGVKDVLIENNIAARHVFPEPDAHLDFIQFQGNDSSDIVVRGNVLLPENNFAMQGIFFDDAHYTNVLVEQNIIVTGMLRGVSVSSGTNVVARNNTVLDIEGSGVKATKVIVDGDSYGNIQGSYLQNSSMGDNVTLQQADPSAPLHYDAVFANATKGFGMSIEDLTPVPGSLAEKYGAYERLMQLLESEPFSPASSDLRATPQDPLYYEPDAPNVGVEPGSFPSTDGTGTSGRGNDEAEPQSPEDKQEDSDGDRSFFGRLIEIIKSLFGGGGSEPQDVAESASASSTGLTLGDIVPITHTLSDQQHLEEDDDEADFDSLTLA